MRGSSRDTLVIARTDAVAVEGFDKAIERALLYRGRRRRHAVRRSAEDAIELSRMAAALGGVPLMANMVEGGKTPPLSAAELEAIGFALVIFPGGIVRALGRYGERILRFAGRAWHLRAVPQPHARLHRSQ